MGAFDKGVETYNFSAILEITEAALEGNATRLMVSRHSDSISGPKVSKKHANKSKDINACNNVRCGIPDFPESKIRWVQQSVA